MRFLRILWQFIFWGLIVLVLVGTFLPLIPSSRWWVRMWDYPRLQAFFLALLAMLMFFIFYYHRRKRGKLLMLLLAGVVVYQAVKAFPYTPFAPKQVLETEGDPQDTSFLSLLVVNVLQYNKNHLALLKLIEEKAPDIVLTLESDSAWQKALDRSSTAYPHAVRIPLDNTYGMHLYSRLPLKETEVLYLLEPDIPSIQTRVQLPSGEWIQLYAVHPRPPVPGESGDSRERDAEIVMIGKMAKEKSETGGVVVAGDFNDVAWSPTTDLFQEISGLLDPRIGRGFYNTFHAQYPLFRWPLDHVFHSHHFKLSSMERLPDIGSDHFPIMIRLSYEPEEKAEQEQPLPDEDTREKADKLIEKGVNDKDAPGD
ncbi:endonuclease/exonuclease/phosphatase family protein [Cesiribacter sp. SM1]|uniref:endonuclease/exonuclease/phosphatase family protein n=1 Tax=Cesiribacter sp. SM1 TaxID=2861196 RepID=UPI001CD2761F|nr:endonuclease/exonuclease/phosphatase family protein [Cesiribacter sp. SM1]